MEPDHRSREEIMWSASPWKRGGRYLQGMYIEVMKNSLWHPFDAHTEANMDLDIHTKRAALKVSQSVVSIASFTGKKAYLMGSGTIIACDNFNGKYYNTIFTSASFFVSSANIVEDIKVKVYLFDGTSYEIDDLAYDFHYNIATFKIKTDEPIRAAKLRLLNDSFSFGDSAILPHSNKQKLSPGDRVIAIGRHFREPYNLMAAPGVERCSFDCEELFRTDCIISKCGIGGPLVNICGEVIGLNFYDQNYMPFLPINIALKCLDQLRKHRKCFRPWLGMELRNLYCASFDQLERLLYKFPNFSTGVIVDEVIPGSPAAMAEILRDDVIVKCGGHHVSGLLQLYELLLDNAGPFEMVVAREKSGSWCNITLFIAECSPDQINQWPLPEVRRVRVKRLRLYDS